MGTKIKDETGKTYGKLTVIDVSHSTVSGIYWNCKCECGTIKVVRGSKLRTGNTRSCRGCFRRGKPRAQRNSEIAPYTNLFCKYQANAKKRNTTLSLTFRYFQTLVKSNCYYCKSAPSNVLKLRRISNNEFTYNGIDRIDSSKGYTKHNVVPCCKACNYAKSTMSLQQFKEWVIQIYRNLDSWAEK